MILGIVIGIAVACIFLFTRCNKKEEKKKKPGMYNIDGFILEADSRENAIVLKKIIVLLSSIMRGARRRLEGKFPEGAEWSHEELELLDRAYEQGRYRLDPTTVRQTTGRIPDDMDATSYTIGKGKLTSICLQNASGREKFGIVAITSVHELAHMCDRGSQHNPTFWNIYRLLQKICREDKLIKRSDLPEGSTYKFCDKVELSRDEFMSFVE